ncbi:hypothetical protein [Zooshikella ganghwensis]|uniref:Uncharacterized protein n=1 Tax=Zooshikella ganghwensis TaxID=202772 RepID=A0A4V1INJ0_9GAMM|nr:hypothetical protein [Zooshikella ganghwensis]RDH43901.1 hypothetical protein B9G39_10850 [Zooshikella ganghwensis]
MSGHITTPKFSAEESLLREAVRIEFEKLLAISQTVRDQLAHDSDWRVFCASHIPIRDQAEVPTAIHVESLPPESQNTKASIIDILTDFYKSPEQNINTTKRLTGLVNVSLQSYQQLQLFNVQKECLRQAMAALPQRIRRHMHKYVRGPRQETVVFLQAYRQVPLFSPEDEIRPMTIAKVQFHWRRKGVGGRQVSVGDFRSRLIAEAEAHYGKGACIKPYFDNNIAPGKLVRLRMNVEALEGLADNELLFADYRVIRPHPRGNIFYYKDNTTDKVHQVPLTPVAAMPFFVCQKQSIAVQPLGDLMPKDWSKEGKQLADYPISESPYAYRYIKPRYVVNE